jgi:hypothetical protein
VRRLRPVSHRPARSPPESQSLVDQRTGTRCWRQFLVRFQLPDPPAAG